MDRTCRLGYAAVSPLVFLDSRGWPRLNVPSSWGGRALLTTLAGIGLGPDAPQPLPAAPSPILVVLVEDALRGDTLVRKGPEGGLVAPDLAAWAASGAAHRVESTSTDPGWALAGLLGGAEGTDLLGPLDRGATRWVAAGATVRGLSLPTEALAGARGRLPWLATIRPVAAWELPAALDSLLITAAADSGPQLLVVLGRGVALPWALPGHPDLARFEDRRWLLTPLPEDGPALHRAHDVVLAATDAHLGSMLQRVDDVLGPRAVTVVTALRGIGLGGHESLGHDALPRIEQVEVPFLVRGGELERTPATTARALDQVVTALLRIPPSASPASWISVHWPAGRPAAARVREPAWSLILPASGPALLFDPNADPSERRDLAAARPGTRDRLAARARAELSPPGSVLILRVESGDHPDLVTLDVTGDVRAAGTRAERTEGLDMLDRHDGHVRLAVATDRGGDAVVVALDDDWTSVQVTIAREPLEWDEGLLPWRVGPTGAAEVGDRWDLTFLSRRMFAARTDTPVDSLLVRSRGRGVDVWWTTP